MILVKKEDCLGYWSQPRFFSFLALTYIAFAQEGKQVKKNIANAKGVVKMLKKWADAGNPNIVHFMKLIEAEMAAVLKPKTAGPLYETAIKLASRAGLRHDMAAAHHRAARYFFVVQKDDHWGSFHIDKAVQEYSDWGAISLAKHLAKNYMAQGKRGSRFSEEITMSKSTRNVLSQVTATAD